MLLPNVETEDEARELIDIVLSDDRMNALRQELSPRGGLPRVIRCTMSRLDAVSPQERPHAQRTIDRWQRIVHSSHDEAAPGHPLEALRHDARTWDFRLGKERDKIPTSQDLLPESVVELITGLADDWQMRRRDRAGGSYDAIVPIGGLVRSNLTRPATVAMLLEHQKVRTSLVMGLASARSISEAEVALSTSLGVPGNTEQEALKFGLEKAFELDPDDWITLAGDEDLFMSRTMSGLPVGLGIAAPNPTTGQRATTGEAFESLLPLWGLAPSARVLQVTTSLYWIANQISLRVSCPRTMRVSTTGQLTELRSGRAQQYRSQHFLQELKSVADALPGLASWAGPAHAGPREDASPAGLPRWRLGDGR